MGIPRQRGRELPVGPVALALALAASFSALWRWPDESASKRVSVSVSSMTRGRGRPVVGAGEAGADGDGDGDSWAPRIPPPPPPSSPPHGESSTSASRGIAAVSRARDGNRSSGCGGGDWECSENGSGSVVTGGRAGLWWWCCCCCRWRLQCARASRTFHGMALFGTGGGQTVDAMGSRAEEPHDRGGTATEYKVERTEIELP